MPFSANKHFKSEPRLVSEAKGVYFKNNRGEPVIDGVSGLFCTPAGHGRKEIADACHKQLLTLDYVPPFQFGHDLSFDLARRVAELLPGDLDYVFFANSGSEAIDSAMKIALQFHRSNGQAQRTRFVSRERGYHGVNFGGLSLAGMVRNRETFGNTLPGVSHIRHTWQEETRFARGEPDKGAELADDLQRHVDLYGADTIAACFVEPIAGSTGILVPPKGYLKRLRQICDKHGILLVFDEVICGFGRTGKAFGAQAFGVTPDLLTMAKGITNGNIPMGAVGVSEKVYKTIVDNGPAKGIEFFHGYTYSAHPVACAAGLATLDIFKKEKLFDKADALAPYFLDKVYALREIPIVSDIRGYGLLAGIDLQAADKPGVRGYEVLQDLFNSGMLARVTVDTLILAPAFICEHKHIDEIIDKVRRVLSRHAQRAGIKLAS
ncbi:MAG: aminotransferase class III-fold pyridoxal phosphate-dependent enzyme [Alphaproteobacteria bacterium]|nr:aminotransferase class III-fold pyridoxal phosphate-dependent enzyme [Alphaproteobacteria bacterium]